MNTAIAAITQPSSPDRLNQSARGDARSHRYSRKGSYLLARPHAIADGVWLLSGGVPVRGFNVYLLRDGEGLTAFDAGTRPMAAPIRSLLGGQLKKVVLGHAHYDHRGGAGELGVPVYCHPEERADAEGDGGEHYFDEVGEGFFGVRGMPLPFARFWLPPMINHWDGGPVKIAGTVIEGDEVAGFEVVDLPGHTPGSIALWRSTDRLVLTSDCFYNFGVAIFPKGEPRLPTEHFNFDTDLARASIRKVADLNPAAAWPGHFDPVLTNTRARLLRAAE
jgi:hydroxyacylglutathione hydrolase